jgi:cytidylate kinase
MKKMIIAIDGFSSTGKSTIAKQLAKHLGYVYVDTGAMYRAVALFAMQNGYINASSFDSQTLINALPDIRLKFQYNEQLGFAEMFLNDENVENQIRTLEVSQYVSRTAELSEVRAKLVEQQQKMGQERGIVMDGRDIGTVVFPDAEVKIFMNSSAETRAQRRFDELTAKGQDVTYEAVLKNVQERDYIDTHREDSPLTVAEDAIEIDNSKLDKDQQFAQVMQLVQKAIK